MAFLTLLSIPRHDLILFQVYAALTLSVAAISGIVAIFLFRFVVLFFFEKILIILSYFI